MGIFGRGRSSKDAGQADPSPAPAATPEPEPTSPAQSQYASLGNVPTSAQAVPAAGHQYGTYDGKLHPVSAATIERLTGIKQRSGEGS